MKTIVKTVLLPVALSIACFGVVVPLFQQFATQPAIASSVEMVSQPSTPAPAVTLIGEIESRRTYQLTINSSDDRLYIQCSANYAASPSRSSLPRTCAGS
jgi:hypothetical protein